MNFAIPFPPFAEQKSIANYLDKKTDQIDKLIIKKRRLIELLLHERIAIINASILRGVKKGIKLKPTGFEWLNEVPNNWDIKRLRFLGSCQNGISQGKEYFGSGFPFLTYGDAYKNESIPKILSGLAQSTEDDRIHYSVLKGDVFFTRTSETIEEIGIASTCEATIPNATFSGFLIRFRPHEGTLHHRFSKYFFRSLLHRKYFVKEMNLVTRASLSQDVLKNLPVLIPPLNEQKLIADFIEFETQRIDNTIKKIEREIKLIMEFRRSLISEVITGKVKVYES
jgi:type I restriction enzyme S subunit